MKKFIAISVVLALVVTGAFAETRVSGSVEVRWNILEIDENKDGTGGPIARTGTNTSAAGGVMHAGVVQLSHADPDEGIRGVLKLQWEGYNAFSFDSAWIEWKPIDQVAFFLGRDGDGKFQNSNLTRWAFHRMPRGISVEGWDGHGYIIGAWDGAGAALTVNPIDMINVNLVLNLADRDALEEAPSRLRRWEDVWQDSFLATVNFNLDFGRINLTYSNISYGWPWGPSFKDIIGVSFHSNRLIDGIELEVGGHYRPEDDANPIRLGLGVFWNGGDFGVKFRSLARIPGSADDRLYIASDIMPWYMTDFAEIRLSVRLIVDQTGSADPTIGWHVNPYIVKGLGPVQFRAGIMLEDDNGDGTLGFKLPISFILGF